jgi:hypothetical protein
MLRRPIAIASVSLVVGAALSRPARSQEQTSLRGAVALGPSVAFGSGASGGMHATVSLQGRITDRVFLRATGVAHRLAVAVAQPSCVPQTPRCESYTTPYPETLLSWLLSVVLPTRAIGSRLYMLTGAGVHHGSGYRNLNDRYGTTGGVSAGVGISSGGAGTRGLALEAEYHYLVGGLGDLRGILLPSLALRF